MTEHTVEAVGRPLPEFVRRRQLGRGRVCPLAVCAVAVALGVLERLRGVLARDEVRSRRDDVVLGGEDAVARPQREHLDRQVAL